MPSDLIVVAGPNGAGKTTYAHEVLSERPIPYLSADAIAGELAPEDPASERIRAGRMFLERLVQRINEGSSLIVESTLSGLSMVRHLRSAREAGYGIAVIFIFLDSPETCIARVEERVRAGGHHVPSADIRRRYFRSLSNFWSLYRPLADRWLLSYNAAAQFQDVAIGTQDTLTVRDEAVYQQFHTLTERRG